MIHPLIGVLRALMSTTSPVAAPSIGAGEGATFEIRSFHPSAGAFHLNTRSEQFKSAAQKVLAILHDLSVRRELFRKTGDLLELYPTFACNMVVEDLNYLLRSDSNDSAILLDVVVTFYDAHQANRQAFRKSGMEAVEPHWRRYFKRAAALNKTNRISQRDVLLLILDGTAAHLMDLPRALSFVAKSYGKPLDPVKALYDGIDPLVSQSVSWSIRDIRTALRMTNTRLIERMMAIGASYVIHERRRAWTIATKCLPVPTRDPQPVLTRRDLDTREFRSVLHLVNLRTSRAMNHS